MGFNLHPISEYKGYVFNLVNTLKIHIFHHREDTTSIKQQEKNVTGMSVGPGSHANPSPQDYSCIGKLHTPEAKIHPPTFSIFILVWKNRGFCLSCSPGMRHHALLSTSFFGMADEFWMTREWREQCSSVTQPVFPLCGSSCPWDAHSLSSWLGSYTCLCR